MSAVEAAWIGQQVAGLLLAGWVAYKAWGDWRFARTRRDEPALEFVTLRSVVVVGLLLASKVLFLAVGVLAATIPERIYHEEQSELATVGLILGDLFVDGALAAEAYFRWVLLRRERRS